ncbi:MAG: hypothetical protein JWR49_989 [Tardiphaga sp.]|nr:hypothetical protein [Tardiphaga sp.]
MGKCFMEIIRCALSASSSRSRSCPSMAGSSDGSLPGIGTFSYNGSPLIGAPAPIVVAAAR